MNYYEILKKYYTDMGLEELQSRPNSVAFFDDEEESTIIINDMDKVNIESIIYKNDISKILNIDELVEKLSIINKHTFTFVEEIVFVINDSDIEYLEEHYCVELNDDYLGQYNSENSILIVDLRGILDRAYSILDEQDILNEYTLNNFTSEEVLITLIHEAFHSVVDKDETCSLNEVLPFNLTEVEDEEMEEVIVERFAKKIVSKDTYRLTLFNHDFIKKYIEESDEIVMDTF